MRARMNVNAHSPQGGWRKAGLRALAVGAMAALPLVATATPASAATGVSVSGGVLTVTSGSAADNLSINLDTDGAIIVRNDGTLSPSAPCRLLQPDTRVRCPANSVSTIKVDLGGGNDIMRHNTNRPLTVDLRDGNDRFFGGSNEDRIFGGNGTDTLEGAGGNDLIVGGPGTDTGNGGPGTADLCTTEIQIACED